MTDITNLKSSVDRIKEIDKQISKLSKERSELHNKLRTNCTHPTTFRNNRYVEGGYWDRSYSEVWDECTICGHRMNMKTYYGGYA